MFEIAKSYGHSGIVRVRVNCPDFGRRVYTGLNLDWSAPAALENGDADLIADGSGD